MIVIVNLKNLSDSARCPFEMGSQAFHAKSLWLQIMTIMTPTQMQCEMLDIVIEVAQTKTVQCLRRRDVVWGGERVRTQLDSEEASWRTEDRCQNSEQAQHHSTPTNYQLPTLHCLVLAHLQTQEVVSAFRISLNRLCHSFPNYVLCNMYNPIYGKGSLKITRPYAMKKVNLL